MKDHRQMKFPCALWTCSMIARMIAERFGASLSRWSVMRLLNQLGLSPQRPLWRAQQQDPAMVAQWVHLEYPKIRALAKQMKAEIYFGDEAGVRTDHHAGTTLGRRGQTPVVSSTWARFGLSIVDMGSYEYQSNIPTPTPTPTPSPSPTPDELMLLISGIIIPPTSTPEPTSHCVNTTK